jgi:molybdopterin-guanine dinucleotide biosynthesis protein A
MNIDTLIAAECPAYILAGGQSARFGSDKAQVTIDGKSLLCRLLESLTAAGHPVHVIADRAERYQSLGINCLVDAEPQCGPLAGLMTAIEHRRRLEGEGWLLLVNCDQVEWFPEWLMQLAAVTQTSAWAVTFEQAADAAGSQEDSAKSLSANSNYRQPIPGLYHSHMQMVVRQALSARQLSLQSLLRQVPSLAVIAPNNPSHWSFNTPEELAEIQRRR